jgi:hypothetical protein
MPSSSSSSGGYTLPLACATHHAESTHLILGNEHHELYLCNVLWEWEAVLHKLQKRDTCRPDIGPDTVLIACKAFRLRSETCQVCRVARYSTDTYSHVETRPSKSSRVRVDELARNTEVTEFDDTLARQEHVWWLYVPVNGLL